MEVDLTKVSNETFQMLVVNSNKVPSTTAIEVSKYLWPNETQELREVLGENEFRRTLRVLADEQKALTSNSLSIKQFTRIVHLTNLPHKLKKSVVKELKTANPDWKYKNLIQLLDVDERPIWDLVTNEVNRVRLNLQSQIFWVEDK